MPRKPSSLPTLLALLVAPVAAATVMTPLDLPTLVSRSDRIVLARVERQAARWTGDRAAIVTEVTLRVEQVVKGSLRAGERVQVLREGGELEGVGMRVEGAAEFAPGEEVLVFLEQRGGSTWTVGMAQGKLRVESVAGRQMVTRNLRGLAFTGSRGLDPALPNRAARPLDDVLADIAALQAAPREGR